MGQITKRQNLIKFKITLSMIIDFFISLASSYSDLLENALKAVPDPYPNLQKADPRLLENAKFIIRIKDSSVTNL